MGALDADRVKKRHQVVDVVPDLERMPRLVGVSVAEHVDRPGGEVLGVGLQVAHICLGVTAGTVEKHKRRAAGITGVQVAGAHPARVEIALRERDALKIAPDALELPHSSPSLKYENPILVFCKHSAHLSHIYVHYSQSITLASADVKEGAQCLRRAEPDMEPSRGLTVRRARRPWPGVWRRCSWSRLRGRGRRRNRSPMTSACTERSPTD